MVNHIQYENVCGNLIYAHGHVDSDMVLGVNDVSQIAAPSLFEGYDDFFINEVIKQKTNELNGRNTDKKAFELLQKSDLIYIYGMSIGATDKLWWDRICTLMRDINLILENIVYMELLRRGYAVTVGKAGDKEIDFVCQKQDQKLYVQVCYLLASEETINREFGVYTSLPDNFPKYVVSMDDIDMSRNGIKHRKIRDFLTQTEWN